MSVTYQERKRRRLVVAAWVQANGWVCPGWMSQPHPSMDLTADHTLPRLYGGEHGPLGILCRRCNSRRGTWTSPEPWRR